MRCYKCQRYSHFKEGCKKFAVVCVKCGKWSCQTCCSADPHCINCRGDHTASNKCLFCPVQRGNSIEIFSGSQFQRATETESLAKRRAEKTSGSYGSSNRFASLTMEAQDTISSIWGDSSTLSSWGPPPFLWSDLPPSANPFTAPGKET
ncbi:nucleic-acid-binding protein from mobile element jockey [Plakobranchus ocellatus]|uniref:Nucleic-acid-binding protein from mobile element jockey n=1 Tax=Plakobranchus ocellatus TaxID=259542 RepID=A0AAV4CS61_9GAST|nr:nucleic-acid-binding protein from mobile element jockey [Plakobranchus ocellatus]